MEWWPSCAAIQGPWRQNCQVSYVYRLDLSERKKLLDYPFKLLKKTPPILVSGTIAWGSYHSISTNSNTKLGNSKKAAKISVVNRGKLSEAWKAFMCMETGFSIPWGQVVESYEDFLRVLLHQISISHSMSIFTEKSWYQAMLNIPIFTAQHPPSHSKLRANLTSPNFSICFHS